MTLRGKAAGAAALPVFGGGIIPAEDEVELRKLGVAALFKPGASTDEIIRWVETHIRPR